MAKAKGRLYVKTDARAKQSDFGVSREATVTFYPRTSAGDRPVEVTVLYLDKDDAIAVLVDQREQDGRTRRLSTVQTQNQEAAPVERVRQWLARSIEAQRKIIDDPEHYSPNGRDLAEARRAAYQNTLEALGVLTNG